MPGAGRAWRPTERQLQPVVQGALNRQLFRALPHHWLKEVDLPRRAAREHGLARGARLDLAVFVHRGRPPRAAGLHAIEVKMGDDRDGERLARQLALARLAADHAWLVVVDGEPAFDADPAVGLARYDLADDRVTVVRAPRRARAPPLAPLLLGAFLGAGRSLADRIERHRATRPTAGRAPRRVKVAAPAVEPSDWAEDPWEPA